MSGEASWREEAVYSAAGADLGKSRRQVALTLQPPHRHHAAKLPEGAPEEADQLVLLAVHGAHRDRDLGLVHRKVRSRTFTSIMASIFRRLRAVPGLRCRGMHTGIARCESASVRGISRPACARAVWNLAVTSPLFPAPQLASSGPAWSVKGDMAKQARMGGADLTREQVGWRAGPFAALAQ